MPYNVVDSQNLKNELLTNAKKIPDGTRKRLLAKEKPPWLNKEKYDAYEIEGKVKAKGKVKDVSRRVYTMKDIDINQKQNSVLQIFS